MSSEAESSHSIRTITITITVLYFAAASTATGTPRETVELPILLPPDSSTPSISTVQAGFPLSALADFLSRRYPGRRLDEVLETSRWSVDAEMVERVEEVMLRGGEEVAVICPVSGG